MSHKPQTRGWFSLFELGKIVGEGLNFLVADEPHNALHCGSLAIVARATLDVLHLLLGIGRVLAGELGIGGQQRLLGVGAVTGVAGLLGVELGAVEGGERGSGCTLAITCLLGNVISLL